MSKDFIFFAGLFQLPEYFSS